MDTVTITTPAETQPAAPQPKVAATMPTIEVSKIGKMENGMFIPHSKNIIAQPQINPTQPASTPETTPGTQLENKPAQPAVIPTPEPIAQTQPASTPETTPGTQLENKPAEIGWFVDENLNKEIQQQIAQTPYYKNIGAKLGKEFQNEQEFEQHVLELNNNHTNLQRTSVNDPLLLALEHAININPNVPVSQTGHNFWNLVEEGENIERRDANGRYVISSDDIIKKQYARNGVDVQNDEEFLVELEGMSRLQKDALAQTFRQQMKQQADSILSDLKTRAKENVPKYSAESIQRQKEWEGFVNGYENYAKTAPNSLNGVPVNGLDMVRTKYIADAIKNGKIIDNMFRDSKTKQLDYNKMELAVMLFDATLNPDQQKNFLNSLHQRMFPQQEAQVKKEIATKMMNFPEVKPQAARTTPQATIEVKDLPKQLQKTYQNN